MNTFESINTFQSATSASSLLTPEYSVPAVISPVQTGRFTLTHLLIVIAVVGLLSALVTPTVFPISAEQTNSAGNRDQPLQHEK